jgi:hypothetical protein
VDSPAGCGTALTELVALSCGQIHELLTKRFPQAAYHFLGIFASFQLFAFFSRTQIAL